MLFDAFDPPELSDRVSKQPLFQQTETYEKFIIINGGNTGFRLSKIAGWHKRESGMLEIMLRNGRSKMINMPPEKFIEMLSGKTENGR